MGVVVAKEMIALRSNSQLVAVHWLKRAFDVKNTEALYLALRKLDGSKLSAVAVFCR